MRTITSWTGSRAAWIFPAIVAWRLLFAPSAHAQDDFFGADKRLHFGASALLSVGSYALCASLDEPPPVRYALAFGVPLLAGVGKEVFDLAAGGDASARDLAWDIIGTATGVGVAWLVSALVDRLAPETVQDPTTVRAPRIRYFFFTK